MKCHYEVLEVSKNADDSEIKSAYRKLALKWHPDKNLDNADNAKEQFQIVQQAYEVLSDRQERAWYDNHREQILRGSNSEFQDKSLDIFQYFTTSCFKGYGDEENGFYTVYRKVFEQIAQEDIDFMDEKEEFCEIPSFGNSNSDYDSIVAPFYNYWMSYSTKKSYSWLDPYDIREGKGDRRVLKLIEKENKKVRQKARKERNEEIRNLVAFVRKRDKRVKVHSKLMEAKASENKKKQALLSKQKRLERKKLHESETQAEWAKFDNVESELKEIEKNLAEQFGEEFSDSEEDSEEDFNNLYCVACNKVFKTPKAFENHESSKKHKENVEKLKETMLEEESLEQESDISDNLEDYNLDGENEELEEIIKVDIENDIQSGTDSLELEEVESVKSKKKNKNKNVLKVDLNDDKEEFKPDKVEDSDEDFDFGSSKKRTKKNKKVNTNKTKEVKNEINSESVEEPTIVPSTKKNKKDKKNRKEIAESDLLEVDIDHCCVTCKASFSSKNKLFDHLKKSGHGIYLPSKVKQSKKKK